MNTVQPSTVLDNPVSTDTEAEQSAMNGAELAANRQNISDISDGPEPSRTFSRMRKTRSLHYAFDKIVDHDLTGPEPVYKIRCTSRSSSEDTWESIWNIPSMLWRAFTAVMDSSHHPFTRTLDRSGLYL